MGTTERQPTAEDVREWRRRTGISAAAAGRLVYVAGRTWQRWEAGEVFPSTAQVFRLADHFGLDPRDLINDRSAA